MSAELPPEVQAVLDAALEVAGKSGFEVESGRWGRFANAVDAYRRSIAPPEPFERYVVRFGKGWDDCLYDERPALVETGIVWRCTVTPIERVRP